MAQYKVIQDIEAEDKLVGPLSLRQFIYACIAALCAYLSFLVVTKGAPYMLVIFVPIMGVCGFFAFPFRQDQPTEVWALAKIRFFFKPRRRVWDQSGTKELVTVTAPKVVERRLTNGLNQDEVQSRLEALASTIDSRGWAVKNVNVNLSTAPTYVDTSDRLVAATNLPQAVSDVDVRASDDILDAAANPVAQTFDTMMSTAAANKHKQLVAQMAAPAPTPTVPVAAPVAQVPANYWFMQPQPTTAPGQAAFTAAVVAPGSTAAASDIVETPEEIAIAEHARAEKAQSNSAAYGNMKTVKTPEQLAAEDAVRRAAEAAKPPVTPKKQAAIMSLASNDDLDVATLARQAKKADDGEVVISLH